MKKIKLILVLVIALGFIFTNMLLAIAQPKLDIDVNVDTGLEETKGKVTKEVSEAKEEVTKPLEETKEKLTKEIKKAKEELKEAININTATKEQLEKLPGIGEAIAQNIIDYRNKYGTFKSIDEIIKVKGIGEKRFEIIKDFITVTVGE
jgi:comEA protein